MKSLKALGLGLFISAYPVLDGFCNPPPTLPDSGTGSTTAFTEISSDYGPRNFTDQIPSNTNPHGDIIESCGWTLGGFEPV